MQFCGYHGNKWPRKTSVDLKTFEVYFFEKTNRCKGQSDRNRERLARERISERLKNENKMETGKYV